MKPIAIVLTLLLYLQVIQAQDIKPVDMVVLEKGHIIGRWIEKTRFLNAQDTVIPKQPYTYIFKEDGMFHRGMATNDVLIFNVAGRYNVEEDLIKMSYRDYTNQRPGGNKERNMVFKVIAWAEDQMTILVSEFRGREYTVILTKTLF